LSAYSARVIVELDGRPHLIAFVSTDYFRDAQSSGRRSVACFELDSGRRRWLADLGPNPIHYLVCDLDGDGRDEIVVGTHAPNNQVSAGGTSDSTCSVLAFGLDGTERWRTRVGGAYCEAGVHVGVLEPGGRPQLLVNLRCRESADGTIDILDPPSGQITGHAPWQASVWELVRAESLEGAATEARVLAVTGEPELLLLDSELAPRARRPVAPGAQWAMSRGIMRTGTRREPLLLLMTSRRLLAVDGALRTRWEIPFRQGAGMDAWAVETAGQAPRVAIRDGSLISVREPRRAPPPWWAWLAGGAILLIDAAYFAWPAVRRRRRQRIGRYRLVGRRPLGSGGMGETWLARPLSAGRFAAHPYVVIKFLRPELAHGINDRLRFQREAEIVARLVHPHIAQVLHADLHAGRPYIVMQFIPGLQLAHRLVTGLSIREVGRIGHQIASALEFAHAHGVVHRDVSPRNIMVDDLVDDGPRATLLDFGLAKLLHGDGASGPKLSQTQQLFGTPGFIPPERLELGISDELGDVWSLGAVLFECLSGVPAFEHAVSIDRLRTTPPWDALPESLPARLRVMLERCLGDERATRPSMRQVREELAAAGGSD
jgi:hypothetical protein